MSSRNDEKGSSFAQLPSLRLDGVNSFLMHRQTFELPCLESAL